MEAKSESIIEEQLTNKAIHVFSESDVRPDGRLYYIAPNNQYAFMLNGKVFRGNIGKIYGDQKKPSKIKECKFAKECNRESCAYFHDPRKYPESSDTMNYMSHNLHYEGTERYPRKHDYKTYGDRENLSIDILRTSATQITRNHYLAMHEILISLIVKELGQ